MSKETVYEFGRVMSIEGEFKKKHLGGAAKDAQFEDELIGKRVKLDNGVSFIMSPENVKCEVGDTVWLHFMRDEKIVPMSGR